MSDFVQEVISGNPCGTYIPAEFRAGMYVFEVECRPSNLPPERYMPPARESQPTVDAPESVEEETR